MQFRTTKVGLLRAGQVISLPDVEREPAWIGGISDPVGDVRFIEVRNLVDGEPNPSRLVLGLDRRVMVHDIEIAEHAYKNATGERIDVALGARAATVAPGEVFVYIGAANEDVFPSHSWTHTVHPIDVESRDRPV